MKKTKVLFLLVLFLMNFNIAFADEHKAIDNWSADATIHYKKCAVEGCTQRFEEEVHTGGNHTNNGQCLVCQKKYQTHNKDKYVLTINEEGHMYGCSYKGCQETFFSPHEESEDIAWNGEMHWYKCTNLDCEKRFEEEEHCGGDENEGVCEFCKRKYEGELDEFKIKDNEGYIVIDEVGDKLQLEIEYFPENLADDNFLWEIEDDKIATITQDGVIEGVDKGITKLTVKWRDMEISYNVYVELKTFEIYLEDDVLIEGEKNQVKIRNQSLVWDVKWSISSNKWATIDKKGIVTVKGGGAGNEVTITATFENMVGITTAIIEHGEIVHTEDGGYCEVCGEDVDGHELSKYYDYDEKEHWLVCENKVCKNKKFNKGNHTSSKSCSVCGWVSSQGGGTGSGGSEQNPGSGSGSESGSGTVWKSNDYRHWKVDVATGEVLEKTREKHVFVDGKCVCGRTERKIVCDHVGKERYKVPLGNGQHEVWCAFCNTLIGVEACTEDCDCQKFKINEIKTEIDMPIKVYYVEEDGLVSVEGDQIGEIKMNIKSEHTPKFEWTMETIPDETFDSESNNVSDDGTIVFWYENGTFKAKLADSQRKVLSEEVKISITLIDGYSRDYETIKLIKNGPPRSYCQVYLDNTLFSLKGGKMKLLVVTKYDEFDDEQVREIGENELPIYKVKNNSVKITNENGDIISVPSSVTMKPITDGSYNGYYAEMNVNALKEGSANLKIELTTEYTFNKHKTQEMERKYSANIGVGQTEVNQDGGVGGNNSPLVELPMQPGNNENNGGGGAGIGLAVIGVIGLLAVAVIGAKMFGHH